MKQLNDKIITWLKHHNIDKLSPDKQYLKIIEEVGELAKGLLYEKHDEIKDAIGDIYVALVGYSLQHNIDDIYEGEDNLYKPQKTIDTLRSFIYHLQESYYWMSYYKMRRFIVYLEYLALNEGLSFKECVEHAYNEIKDRNIRIENGVVVKIDKDDFELGDSRTEKIKIFDQDNGTYFDELVILQEVHFPDFCICGNYKTEPFSGRRVCKLCGKEAKVK